MPRGRGGLTNTSHRGCGWTHSWLDHSLSLLLPLQLHLVHFKYPRPRLSLSWGCVWKDSCPVHATPHPPCRVLPSAVPWLATQSTAVGGPVLPAAAATPAGWTASPDLKWIACLSLLLQYITFFLSTLMLSFFLLTHTSSLRPSIHAPHGLVP